MESSEKIRASNFKKYFKERGEGILNGKKVRKL